MIGYYGSEDRKLLKSIDDKMGKVLNSLVQLSTSSSLLVGAIQGLVLVVKDLVKELDDVRDIEQKILDELSAQPPVEHPAVALRFSLGTVVNK